MEPIYIGDLHIKAVIDSRGDVVCAARALHGGDAIAVVSYALAASTETQGARGSICSTPIPD